MFTNSAKHESVSGNLMCKTSNLLAHSKQLPDNAHKCSTEAMMMKMSDHFLRFSLLRTSVSKKKSLEKYDPVARDNNFLHKSFMKDVSFFACPCLLYPVSGASTLT